jgi:hypothetical protein
MTNHHQLFRGLGLATIGLVAALLAGCSTQQPLTVPLPQAGAQAMVVPATNMVTVPQNLSVTTVAGQNVPVFIRSSNEWFQASGDLKNWANVSRLTANVTFGWTAEIGAESYNLYQGQSSGSYADPINTLTNHVTVPVVANVTNFFVVTAVGADGIESVYSAELAYAPPIVAPRFIIP